MTDPLHITSVDCAGELLARAGLPGEVFVWHDILYDGPRKPGWPGEETLQDRAGFLSDSTGGGLQREFVLKALHRQYDVLARAAASRSLVLWFDACLFDQAMLVHLLACLRLRGAESVKLICVDAFPGIVPFHGLGQLRPDHLASLFGSRQPVTEAQHAFAVEVDRAFAVQDVVAFARLTRMDAAPLPWVPAAVARWLEELPDPATGLGRMETLALQALRAGCTTPEQLFAAVAAAERPPQYWGDTTLWAKVNALAARQPPLVTIAGPGNRLPQWKSDVPLGDFRLAAC